MYKVLFEGEHEVSFIENHIVVDPCYGACIYVELGGKKIIIDPSNRGLAETVLQKLRELGITPEGIDSVLNTHFHYDHSFNNYLFPNANIYTLVTNWLSNRVEAADNVEAILGLRDLHIISTPGHTADHMSFLLEENGKNIIFAGDAVNETIIRTGNIPSMYFDTNLFLQSAVTLLQKADILVPGHGKTLDKQGINQLKEFIISHYHIQ